MARKTVKFNLKGIAKLPNDKPGVYKILTPGGNNNYTGKAKRGRVRERVAEHLGKIPGAKVLFEQTSTVREAEKKEMVVIKRSQPKYNEQGK